ncbi:hypothetical protein FACS189499_03360 [Clostridia bacterium]|nr:hypothetical protein FACS189499_03360 [Clostridia bacterium]
MKSLFSKHVMTGLLSGILAAGIAFSAVPAFAAESGGDYEDYEGVRHETLSIKTLAKNLTQVKAKLGTKTYVYDGNPKRPKLTLTDGNKVLVNGVDYTVTYTNNVAVGTAKVTVKGKGAYTGTRSASFTITSARKSVSTLTGTITPKTFVYDGREKRPVIKLYNSSGAVLVEGRDFNVSYYDNVSVGTAIATVDGIGNYSGERDIKFTITKPKAAVKDISTLSAQLTTGSSIVYDGSAKTPGVAVYDGSTLLRNKVDYYVTYVSNVNPGTATARITGMGNYQGTNYLYFTITPKTAVKNIGLLSPTLSQTSYAYDGYAKTPAVTVRDGYTTLRLNYDYTVTYISNVNPGTANVRVDGTGNYNGSSYLYFTITQAAKSVASLPATLSQTSYAYDGYVKKPSVTIRDGIVTLREGYDYTMSYSGNTNPGTATAKVTGIGSYNGTQTLYFTITNAKSIVNLPASLSQTSFAYDGYAKNPLVTIIDGYTTLRLNYDYTAVYTGNVNPGTATVKVTGIGAYNGTQTLYFTITQAAKNIAALIISLPNSSFNATGNPINATVNVVDGGRLLTQNTDYILSYTNNVNPGTATVTITGIGGYTGSASRNFTITAVAPSRKDIGTLFYTLPETSYIQYNIGDTIIPELTILDGKYKLVKGTDFMVTYVNNNKPGTAFVTAYGIGNYNGTAQLTFTITTS